MAADSISFEGCKRKSLDSFWVDFIHLGEIVGRACDRASLFNMTVKGDLGEADSDIRVFQKNIEN